jgi:hypothetical protein
MDSVFFTFQLGFVILIIAWAMRNDRAGDDDSQQGLFAIRSGLSARLERDKRKIGRNQNRRQPSKVNTKSRKIQ